MAQVFSRHAGLLLAASTVAAVAVIGVLVAVWYQSTRPQPLLGQPAQQPLPFSHKHHVLDDGIDCRYCHTGVETAAHAGLPALSTCMTCHSQLYADAPALEALRAAYAGGAAIQWQRVNDIPDFAYFDHSVHISHGVGCSSCHGRTDQMPLTWRSATLEMAWCLDCHRSPQKVLRPPRQVFDMAWQPPPDQDARGLLLMQGYRISVPHLTDCSTCHR